MIGLKHLYICYFFMVYGILFIYRLFIGRYIEDEEDNTDNSNIDNNC